MLLDELARELVEVTSSLVGGRTINVMNTDGVIVASTEHQRIGSVHEGAREAVATGRTVNIYKDQLDRYPGAKEGCNMPLRVNGSTIGVVGIYGDPDQIRDVAHLLEVYAAKYYQLEAMLRPRLAEATLRNQLLMQLLMPSGATMSAAHSLMETLSIRFRFPVRTIVISCAESLRLPQNGQKLIDILDEAGFLQKNTDIWGIVDERMVLLCSDEPTRDLKVLRTLPDRDTGYRISIGIPCQSLMEIPQAYEQASTLDLSLSGPVNDMNRVQTRCSYMISRTAGGERVLLDDMAKKLLECFGETECSFLLQSVKTYYDCGRSVAAAAQQLFIHKNTLQYRVKRVLEVLEISELSPFWQEYLLRLLIEHLYRKSRS